MRRGQGRYVTGRLGRASTGLGDQLREALPGAGEIRPPAYGRLDIKPERRSDRVRSDDPEPLGLPEGDRQEHHRRILAAVRVRNARPSEGADHFDHPDLPFGQLRRRAADQVLGHPLAPTLPAHRHRHEHRSVGRERIRRTATEPRQRHLRNQLGGREAQIALDVTTHLGRDPADPPQIGHLVHPGWRLGCSGPETAMAARVADAQEAGTGQWS